MHNKKVLKEIVGTTLNGSNYAIDDSSDKIVQISQNKAIVSLKDLFKVAKQFN